MAEGTSATPPWSATEEDVAAFIAQYGTPYDPATDDYAVDEPYATPVKAGKNTAIYNAHSYHTKVPPQGIMPYLEHYTRPGDIVLDPFCGSGMTGVACIMTGRRAILNDLSPAATHIAYNYCTPVDVGALRAAWQQIKDAVADEFAYLYGTTCDRCGGSATIQYTIWSDVYGCPRCGTDLVLWDVALVRDRTAQGYDPPLSIYAPVAKWTPSVSSHVGKPAGSVLDSFPCPDCRNVWRKAQLKRRRAVPVLTVFDCFRCRPRRGEHATNTNEVQIISKIANESIPYWYPTTPFEENREMWRGGHRDAGITKVSDFWTARNLRAMARLWQESEGAEPRIRHALRFVLTSILLGHSNVLSRVIFKGSPQPILTSNQTGTLYAPSLSVEKNLIEVAERKFDTIQESFREVSRATETVLTTVHAGQDLGIPGDSIDYVFTDPPFGSNIFYADCSFLWEAWLGYFTDERYEAVWNKSRKPEQGGKTLADYQRLMTEAFREMHRVLKPGRWASVVFHNSDDRVWNAIREAATDAGFSLENAVAFDKEQRSFKGIKGEKGEERVSNFDIVLNLRKAPVAGQRRSNGGAGGVTADVQERILPIIQAHLRSLADGQPSAPPHVI